MVEKLGFNLVYLLLHLLKIQFTYDIYLEKSGDGTYRSVPHLVFGGPLRH